MRACCACTRRSQLACAVALRNLTVSPHCVEALIEATVDVPPPPAATGAASTPGSAAAQEPRAQPSEPLSGLAALVSALTLGQPHESIKAKASIAAALANCAALAEARTALDAQQLLPTAVGVLTEAMRPVTKIKALAQSGNEQPAVADKEEMAELLTELCAQLCMLLRNAALSPLCKAALLDHTAAVPLLVSIVRTAQDPSLLAQAAGALQNLQDRSEARPGVPTNPIGEGERTMLKVHQLKQRLHAAGDDAEAPLPDSLVAIDDDADDAGPGTRTKRDYRLIHSQKLGATHDVKVRGQFAPCSARLFCACVLLLCAAMSVRISVRGRQLDCV